MENKEVPTSSNDEQKETGASDSMEDKSTDTSGKSNDDGLFKRPAFIGKFPKVLKANKETNKKQSNNNIDVEIQIGVRKPENEQVPSNQISNKKSPAQQISEKSIAIPYKVKCYF